MRELETGRFGDESARRLCLVTRGTPHAGRPAPSSKLSDLAELGLHGRYSHVDRRYVARRWYQAMLLDEGVPTLRIWKPE